MSTGDPRQTHSFKIRVWLARLVVTVERVWPALWPPLAVVGIFAAVSLFGLWLILPPVLHLVLLTLFAAALGVALWRARRALVPASRNAGLSRLERDSGVAHQPLRALDDQLPSDFRDPATKRLWLMHRQRLMSSLDRLRLRPPRSDLPRRDPWAFRAALLLVLVVAVVHARGDLGSRLGSAFNLAGRPAQATLPPMVDLWITPPTYTRRAPLASEQTRGQNTLAVPTGSSARLQAHHLAAGSTAELAYGEATTPLKELGPGSAEGSVVLDRDSLLAIKDSTGQEIASWLIDVVPDAVPTVSFVGEPRATHRSVLRIDLEAADDYGVAELALLLAQPGQEAETERLGLLKPGNQPPKLATGTYLDLTAHPFAGLPVVLRLEAVDAIGQRGQSQPLQFTLPAREFRNPLARAIIEERRKLVAEPAKSGEVAGRLAALGETPAAQQLPVAVPLGLRAAGARLVLNEGDAASRRSVVDMLWEIALFIEDGSLSLAERKLRDLQQELQKALRGRRRGRRARANDGGAAAGDGRVPAGAHAAGAGTGPAGAARADAGSQPEPNGGSPRPAGDARSGPRADAQRRPGCGAGHAGAVAGDAGESARRHPAGPAFAGRAESGRSAEDDPAPATAARAQLQHGSRAAAERAAGPEGPAATR